MDIDTLIGVFVDKFNLNYIEAKEIVMGKLKKKKSTKEVKEGVGAGVNTEDIKGDYNMVESTKKTTPDKNKDRKKQESTVGQLALQHIQQFADENDIDRFDLAQGINVFVRDFRGGEDARALEYMEYVIDQFWGYRPGHSEADQEYEDLEITAQMVYDQLVRYLDYEHYLENIITIKEEIQIGDYILEAGDTIRVLNERRFDLGAGHLGNGIVVWNRAREVHGDYEKIAHIGPDREVKWYIENPPREVIEYVEDIVEGGNPSVSTSQQDQKVFNR